MRAFAWFVGAFVLAGVAGAVLAYPAYELTSSFAPWPFHRVAGRIAMLLLVLLLVWLCRHLRLTRARDFGFALPWRRFLTTSLLWGAIGAASAALGAAFLLITHLRVQAPDFRGSPWAYLHIFAVGLASGISVALLEETVMRGAMHSAIERDYARLGASAGRAAAMAALLTAPLFAVLHFFAKVRIPPEQLHWISGFVLLGRSFEPLAHPSLVFDAFLSWLLVGIILSITRMLTGNIAVAVGLHAGWVLVLRMLQEATQRGTSPAFARWVGAFDGLLGLWLLPWGCLVLGALWVTRRAWVPRARSAPASNAPSDTAGAYS